LFLPIVGRNGRIQVLFRFSPALVFNEPRAHENSGALGEEKSTYHWNNGSGR
jgi:hypothetical protein